MKLKKILSLLLTGGILCGICAGCTAQPTSKSGKVKISIGNWPSVGSEDYKKWYERVGEFNEVYPDIEIVGDVYRYDVSSFLEKAEGGTLPTVFLTHFTEAKKMIEGGYVADVTDQYRKNGYFERTNEFVLENISKDNSVYFIPATAYTLGIVANVNLLKEAGFVNEDGSLITPDTFEELAQMAQTIHHKTGKAGFLIPTTDNAGGWNFSVIGWNYGAKFIEKQGEKWIAAFDSREAENALQFVKDLRWKYDCYPSSMLIDAKDVMELVASGQCAMAFAHPEQTERLANYGMDKEEIAMFRMPEGPEEHTSLMGGSMYAIRSDATEEQKDAAFKWLDFIGVTPSIKKQLIEMSYKKKNESGKIVGLIDLGVWNEKSDYQKFVEEMTEKYINVPKSHVSNYNDKLDMSFQLEEPVCAQELYAVLDRCIQEVLTNKDADCGKVLSEAAADFQKNCLDYE